MTLDEVMAAAKQRADDDCRAAVVQAEADLEHAEEWQETGFENKPHHIHPKRQFAAGMLAHIKESMRKNGVL